MSGQPTNKMCTMKKTKIATGQKCGATDLSVHEKATEPQFVEPLSGQALSVRSLVRESHVLVSIPSLPYRALLVYVHLLLLPLLGFKSGYSLTALTCGAQRHKQGLFGSLDFPIVLCTSWKGSLVEVFSTFMLDQESNLTPTFCTC